MKHLNSTAIPLRSGLEMPSPGFGTWRLGESERQADREIAALRHAFEIGFTHFDTAEMYGDGGSEELLGRALAPFARDRLFITSKFYPWHADADTVVATCEDSLRRLDMDYIDLYLLHWPGSTPIEDTLDGASRLLESGKIRSFGVSNFDDQAIADLERGGLITLIDVNQVLYNPARRGIEFDLLPRMQELGIVCMAYTPIEPDRIGSNRAFRDLANALGLSSVQLALAWHLTRGKAVPIPKASTIEHVNALAEASQRLLADDVLAAIDDIFPPPDRPQPLDII